MALSDKAKPRRQQGQSTGPSFASKIRPVGDERARLMAEGEPVSINPERAEPTFGGNIVRGIARLPARAALNLAGIANATGGLSSAIQGDQEGIDASGRFDTKLKRGLKSEYLGDLYPIGFGKTKKGEYYDSFSARGLLDAIGAGAEGASYLVGGEGAIAGVKELGKGALKQAIKQTAKRESVAGFLQGAGSKAQERDATAGNIIGSGIGGGIIGAGLGAGGAKILGSTLFRGAVKSGKDATSKVFNKSLENVYDILNPSGRIPAKKAGEILSSGKTETRGLGLFKRDIPQKEATPQLDRLMELEQQGIIGKNKTPGQNLQALGQEARRSHLAIQELTRRPEFNLPFSESEFSKPLNEVIERAKKNRVFISKSAEESAYNDVGSILLEEVNSGTKNTAGLIDSIASFNNRMEDIFGADIYYGPNGEATTISKARLQAAKDFRKAAYDYTEKLIAQNKTEAGKLYKSQLQREAQLLNARNEITHNSRVDFGKSRAHIGIERLLRNPTIRGASRAGGLIGGGAVAYSLLKKLGD